MTRRGKLDDYGCAPKPKETVCAVEPGQFVLGIGADDHKVHVICPQCGVSGPSANDLSHGYRLVQAWGSGNDFGEVEPTWFSADDLSPGMFLLVVLCAEEPEGKDQVMVACPSDYFMARPTTLAHGWKLACDHLTAEHGRQPHKRVISHA